MAPACAGEGRPAFLLTSDRRVHRGRAGQGGGPRRARRAGAGAGRPGLAPRPAPAAKSPGFTAVAVLSLALGIGANTALFSVTDAMLLSALPVEEPDRLVLFEWQAGDAFRSGGIDGWSFLGRAGRSGSSSFHSRVYQGLRDGSAAVPQVFAFAELRKANLLVGGQAEVADGQYVSGNYFAALGVTAWRGRLLSGEDDRADAPPAAVLSHAYWQARLGGDPGVLGKTIAINAIPFTVVGVAPPRFQGTLQVDSRPVVFVAVAMEPRLAPGRSRRSRSGPRRSASAWRSARRPAGCDAWWWPWACGWLRPACCWGPRRAGPRRDRREPALRRAGPGPRHLAAGGDDPAGGGPAGLLDPRRPRGAGRSDDRPAQRVTWKGRPARSAASSPPALPPGKAPLWGGGLDAGRCLRAPAQPGRGPAARSCRRYQHFC